MLKTALALILAATPAIASTPPPPYHPTVFLNLTSTHLISCGKPNSDFVRLGTVFRITDNVSVTAAHVVSTSVVCKDEDTNLNLTPYLVDNKNDIALLYSLPRPHDRRLKYSCEGFKPKSVYFATGYANGMDLVVQPVIATKTLTDLRMVKSIPGGFRLLLGDLFHGMSGGPVLDIRGTVIGINNATNGEGSALSRELKQTALCNAH